MTEALDTAIDTAIADLDKTSDLVERYSEARELQAAFTSGIRRTKRVQQQIVLTLKDGRSWRQVGELLGVSGSRAEQISRGK